MADAQPTRTDAHEAPALLSITVWKIIVIPRALVAHGSTQLQEPSIGEPLSPLPHRKRLSAVLETPKTLNFPDPSSE